MSTPLNLNDPAVVKILAALTREEQPIELEEIKTAEDVKRLLDKAPKAFHRFMANPESKAHLDRACLIPNAKALAEIEKAQADAEAAKAEEERLAAQQQRVADETARLQAEQAGTETQPTLQDSGPAVWQAEDDANKALGVTTVRDAQGAITRLVTDYQVTDENGNSVGRPTHLEARSWPELWMKQREAHVQATRAFSRLKAQKVTFRQQQQPKPPSKEEMLEQILKSDDPAQAVAAVKKAAEITPEQKAAQATSEANAALVTYQFLARHINDFNNCEANTKLLGEYFAENNLEWTLDNLEVAFKVLEDQLAPVPARAVPSVPNTAPATPAASAATAASKAAAVPAAPATPAATAQPVTPTPSENTEPVRVEPRPGVNGGIQPGAFSASRIVDVQTTPGQLTRRDVSKWDAKTLMARMRDPIWKPQLEAIGIKVIDKFRQS